MTDYVNINGTEFHFPTVSEMKKEEFVATFENIETIDVEDSWKQIQEMKPVSKKDKK